MTCNMAYRKNALAKAGYFNEEYKLLSEDTDLAQKVLKNGRIEFLPSMLVFHQRKKQTIKKYFRNAFRVFSIIKYIKDTKDYRACLGRIMYFPHLVLILCPPLMALRYRFISLKDIFILPIVYASYVFERILIWIAAAKEGIFLL